VSASKQPKGESVKEKSLLTVRNLYTNGGNMQRFLVALFLILGALGIVQNANAQQIVEVSGYLTPGQTRIFHSRTPGNSLTDTIYRISGRYSVSGTLRIMEGAEVHFLPDSRIVDSSGGKIVANGFQGLARRIQIRGINVNSNSDEWGHIVVLPGADSVYFANVRFAFFRKKERVDRTLHYGTSLTPLANSMAIIKASNGVGGVMTTFSRNTYLYDVIVDSCQAIYRGGAFAFLQAPSASYYPSDDGRYALANGQVRRLLVRDTRVWNEDANRNSDIWDDNTTLGGAIHMAAREGASFSNWVGGFLGNLDSAGLNLPTQFHARTDTMQFERCLAYNPGAGSARGGAIYVGDYTGLTLQLATFNRDTARTNDPDQADAWGGAIAVSKTSADPSWLPPNAPSPAYVGPTAQALLDGRRPGLAIYKRARFLGNVAGLGGAIHLDWQNNGTYTTNGPALYIDGDNLISDSPYPLRDSGKIEFVSNTAYRQGGAVYTNWYTFITGYLAPQNHLPRWDSVELRVHFLNNAAGLAGGAVYLNPNSNPDYHIRRVKFADNFVNPLDARINMPTYKNIVVGGGADFIGTRDSSFAVEYLRNYVWGGNGGATYMNMGQSGPGINAYNRYMVEDKFNAGDPKLSPLPFDQRELTRYLDNWATTGDDSLGTYNRTGRGGGLFVAINNSSTYPVIVKDSLIMSRVRFEENQAFTGSAIHSDNTFLHITANQTLVANNTSTSRHSATVDLESDSLDRNPADPNAGATIWGSFDGPVPSHESNSRGNAIYDNVGRYILRSPDGPAGFGGVDTLRGNFWGETGVDIITKLPAIPIGAVQSTFFIDYYADCYKNVYEPRRAEAYTYTPMPIGKPVSDTLLMEGRVYDMFDRGRDIKTVDYGDRRLAISEAFSLGLPTDVGLPSKGRKGLHRWTRDIFTKDPVYLSKIMTYQVDFTGPHPIGYPLFLQADIDALDFNRDPYARNYTTVFVLNENTQEFVRVNLKEELQDRNDSASHPYKGRIDFVPDSSVATRNPGQRARVFWSPTLIRPSNTTYNEIARAAKLEDSAALRGRFYRMTLAEVMNAAGPDSVCTMGIDDPTQWYAGELYRTLPVRPGDNIVVFSRTQLWKYGYAGAKSRGLSFTIGDVVPPFFVGDIPNLQNDPIHPNRKFLREDVNYEAYNPALPDTVLLKIGGYDINNFYNPAWLFDPFNYTQLHIDVDYDDNISDWKNTRLPWWLKRDTVYNVNPGAGSNGYIQLYGTPHNADVVPGGEAVSVRLTNWPPNYASEHQLLDNFDAVLGADSTKLSHWIFPPYFHCPEGFQDDTLCVRSTYRDYTFRIFVQDSLPIYLTNPATACAANLTDSLRYDYDIQTDDELEDSAALAISIEKSAALSEDVVWDFRYGRTSYALKVGPAWLKSYYADGSRVGELNNFTSRGIMNIRFDSASVYPLITPVPQVNGELLLDTLVAVETDDGHTGKRTQQWRLPINVEPTIVTTAADLPRAKEDFEYSTYFNDSANTPVIRITDPNFADYHTFRLIYKGQTEDIYRDDRYKTGRVTVTGKTPLWLKINPNSGALYGTPGINDAPHNSENPGCGGPDTITVVVEDVCGLTAWKEIELQVDSTAHAPKFFKSTRTLCIRNKTPFCDSIRVTDKDLLRDCPSDTLTITLLEPAGFTATPSTIIGPSADTQWVKICGQFDEDDQYFVNEPLAPRYISLLVTDAQGNMDTVKYQVHVGDIPTFECDVYVSNKLTSTHPVDVQRLCFGAGKFGRDSLDIRYCEIEVPPPGPSSVFDGRWELPVGGSLKGTHIDIRRDTNQYADVTWQIRFQSGSEAGSFLYPIEICWNKGCFDSTGSFVGNFYLVHPNTPSEFSINMNNGAGPINNTFYTLRNVGADSLCLEIRNVGLNNARIVFVPTKSGAESEDAKVTVLEQNYPNPFNPTTTLRFKLAERSNVKIEIFDVKGALVRTLVNEVIESGSYPVVWDATNDAGIVMPTGTYIAKMTAGDYTSSIKMTLSK
jgi:predicted outer membrane repeat protein